ncbi:hypothetical protein KFU94_46500 [Chloroflexi bacterium TSY]|nr:hypothetical protein [Chloroflexi bacterium TSY]
MTFVSFVKFGKYSFHNYRVSKCDLPEIWEHRENITQFATQVFGTQVINEIERYIPPSNYSWHAFSAVGPFYDGSQYETPVTSDLRIRPEHNIQPYGVMDIVTELFRES